jgi:hypothetical protein
LDAFGALFGKQFFHSNFPSFITDDHLHINCLEMLVVIVTVQIWGKKLKGTNNDISTTLSGVTSKVNFLVPTVTPNNSILVVGATLFSGDSSNPQFSNN